MASWLPSRMGRSDGEVLGGGGLGFRGGDEGSAAQISVVVEGRMAFEAIGRARRD